MKRFLKKMKQEKSHLHGSFDLGAGDMHLRLLDPLQDGGVIVSAIRCAPFKGLKCHEELKIFG